MGQVGRPSAFAERQREVTVQSRQSAHRTNVERQRMLIAQSMRLVQQARRHALDIRLMLSATQRRVDSSQARLEEGAPAGNLLARAAGGDGPSRDEHATKGPRSFQAVDELIARVEGAAACDASRLDDLIERIKALLHSDTDQYLLMGILLEGIVQAIRSAVSPAERRGVLVAALAIMLRRTGAASIGAD